MHSDLEDDSQHSEQEYLMLSHTNNLIFFQEESTALEPGSSSSCVEVRGSEKGRAASNFLGKSASVPEGSRCCSRAH